MDGRLSFNGMAIMRESAPCANHCRFCSVGKKEFHNIPFERYSLVVERFLNWRDLSGMADFVIAPVQLHTLASMPPEDLRRRFELCRLGGYKPLPLQINGLVFRPDDELKLLLVEKKEAGFKSLSLTFAGLGQLHDLWCGRRGEYNYLQRIAAIAGEIGFPRLEKIFLTESSWSGLPELMETLGHIPGEVQREVQLVSYVGWARNLENDRLRAETWEKLPDDLKKQVKADGIKTEAQWLKLLDQGYTDPTEGKAGLMIRLREDNLERFQRQDCQMIIDEMKKAKEEAWGALPTLTWLASSFGDNNNDRLYHLPELRRKWLDLLVAHQPSLSGAVAQIFNLPEPIRK
jgi:hypothetical protein